MQRQRDGRTGTGSQGGTHRQAGAAQPITGIRQHRFLPPEKMRAASRFDHQSVAASDRH